MVVLRIGRVRAGLEDGFEHFPNHDSAVCSADSIKVSNCYFAFQDIKSGDNTVVTVRRDLFTISEDEHVRANSETTEQSETPVPNRESIRAVRSATSTPFRYRQLVPARTAKDFGLGFELEVFRQRLPIRGSIKVIENCAKLIVGDPPKLQPNRLAEESV